MPLPCLCKVRCITNAGRVIEAGACLITAPVLCANGHWSCWWCGGGCDPPEKEPERLIAFQEVDRCED